MNIVNCDWSQNKEIEDQPGTHMATMGCVLGTETITCKYKDVSFKDVIFKNIWYMLETELELKVKTNGIGKYIDVEDMYVYDSSIKDYTKVKRVIKNPDVGNWMNVKFDNNEFLTATEDHPLPVLGKGRIFVKDLQVGDKILKANTEDEYVSVVATASIGVINEPSYDVETESDHFDVSGINSHNCRTLIGYDRHGKGYDKTGRGNVCPVTINLPKIGIKHGICLNKRDKADIDGFFKELHEKLQIAEKGLVERFNHICSQSVKAGMFLYENGIVTDSENALKNGIYEVMKHFSLGFGYVGIAETCVAMFGIDHTYGVKEVDDFAERILSTISEYGNEASERNDLNMGCYATPAESTVKTFSEALKKEFGEIKDVTDRGYLTNSHHVPVWREISIYDKLKIESRYTKYPTNGCITYIELESSIMNNTKAIEDIIDYAMSLDIPYLAFNFPIDTCISCGYQGEIEKLCPKCMSTEIQRLRRVTGYLTTDYRKFNDGKIKEVLDRVKHSKFTSFIH